MKYLPSFLILPLGFALALSACQSAPVSPSPTETPSTSAASNIPNPASSFCVEKGYISEIRTASDGSQYGVCKFPDGTECDEWSYFRGECTPGQSATQINTEENTYQNQDLGFSFSYPSSWQITKSEPTAPQNPVYEILIQNNTAKLTIRFMRTDNPSELKPDQIPGGESSRRIAVKILNQDVIPTMIIDAGKVKWVSYEFKSTQANFYCYISPLHPSDPLADLQAEQIAPMENILISIAE